MSSKTELDVEGDIDRGCCRRKRGGSDRDMHPVVKLLVISVGFMTDAYDLFVMGMIIVILREIYNETAMAASAVATAALIGAAVGQLLFGMLGDYIGRKVMFMVTLTLIIVFTLCSAFSPVNEHGPYLALTIFRLFLGFGIGGEYPLSATIAAESSEVRNRGRNMSFVFSMQGFGNLLAPIVVSLILLLPIDLEWVWRLALAVAAIPCIATAYHRFQLHESAHYQLVKKESMSLRETFRLLNRCKLRLLGTAGTWFLFDITFYGNGLFKETVIELIGLSGGDTSHEIVQNTAVASIIIAAMALPGYFLAIPLTDKIGRKAIQLIGFGFVAVLFALMAGTYNFIVEKKGLFIIMYGLTFFWSNLGPNTTTFVIPGEVFGTEIRSTCHGISAAAGKLGAVLGALLFSPVSEAWGYQVTFGCCAGIALVGLIMTLALVPESNNMVLKSARDEDDDPAASLIDKH
ncbi:major facilitator superfamily protein [Pelomyxa schiedti]|nr:major facilitator superfamily protein [Pelomyxa schiedti]